MTTRKMYEGEWSEDIAHCGVLSDMPAEYVPDEVSSRPSAFLFVNCNSFGASGGPSAHGS